VKDRQNKNDKIDAKVILREIVSPMPEHSVVWVPDEETEAARMLARAYDAATVDLKRKKQRLLAFLLVMGHAWNERTATGNLKQKWSGAFRDWLDSISFSDPAAQAAYDLHRRAVDDARELADRAAGLVRAEAAKPRWKPYVDALCRMKGVDVLTAFLVAAEIGDFERFESGRRVSAWLGTTPTESSSGEKDSHGRITKAGNSHVRRTLVEGNAAISRRRASRKKPVPGAAVPEAVESMARKANARLKKRFDHLTGEGLHPNKARVAVVSEQIRWMWAIGRAVQRGLEGGAAM
jgi:transposase